MPWSADRWNSKSEAPISGPPGLHAPAPAGRHAHAPPHRPTALCTVPTRASETDPPGAHAPTHAPIQVDI
eukprot:5290300-Prymnesium_polylepis.1